MSSQLALFNKLRKFIFDGTIDIDTDVIKCALVLNTYTFDATHYKWADISAHEVVAVPSPYNGYDAGGATVTGVTITEVVSPVSAYMDCNDVDWYSLIATFKFAVFYANVTRNGIVNPLIGCVLLDYEGGGSIVVSGVDYKLQIASGGLLTLA